VFQTSCDSHHRLRSYCRETVRRSIRPNFSVHPVGKIMRWIKKWTYTFYDGHDELYQQAKFGEDRTMRAGCRCENMVFFVCWSRSESRARAEHRAFEGCIVRTSIALPFIARFRRGFQCFFNKGFLIQIHYLFRIPVARWRHTFREIAVENCETYTGWIVVVLRFLGSTP